MNPDTGKIKRFESEAEAVAEGYTVPLKREPKPSCKKCHGCGHISTNDEGKYVPCGCTQ